MRIYSTIDGDAAQRRTYFFTLQRPPSDCIKSTRTLFSRSEKPDSNPLMYSLIFGVRYASAHTGRNYTLQKRLFLTFSESKEIEHCAIYLNRSFSNKVSQHFPRTVPVKPLGTTLIIGITSCESEMLLKPSSIAMSLTLSSCSGYLNE